MESAPCFRQQLGLEGVAVLGRLQDVPGLLQASFDLVVGEAALLEVDETEVPAAA